MLLGRYWQYDRKIVHDGVKNTIMLEKDGINIRMLSMKEEKMDSNSNNNCNSSRRVMLCLSRKILKEERVQV